MRIYLFTVLLFNLVMAKCQDEGFLLQKFSDYKSEVSALAFSPDSKLLASASENKDFIVYNLDENTKISEFQNFFPVKDIEFFGNKQLFITSGSDIKLIDLRNQNLAVYKGNATHLWSIDFAPERNKITAGSYDRKIRIWDVQSTEVEVTLEGHEKSTLPVAFSPDELYVVSGSLDQSIKIWNAKTGELIKSVERHSKNIYDVEFHPNGKYFASASDDKTIKLWNLSNGAVIKTYIGHDAAVVDIEFSPDGYFLYSASLDGSVIIWDISTGEKLYSFILHDGGVNEIAVSDNGYLAATGGVDGNVYIYNSAKIIVCELLFGDKINNDKNQDPIFEDRRKGESKEEYDLRSKEAGAKYLELIDAYFEQYKKDKNFKNIP